MGYKAAHSPASAATLRPTCLTLSTTLVGIARHDIPIIALKPRSPALINPWQLHTASQGEFYACALSNIYTFGPTFRAEYSFTARHLAEFWMIEPEMAFCDLKDDMQCAEDYVRYCCRWGTRQAGPMRPPCIPRLVLECQ